MNSNSKRLLLAVALATLGSGIVMTASAQSSAPNGSGPNANTNGRHHRHFRGQPGGPFVGALLRGVRQEGKTNSTLALTSEQQTALKALLKASHPAPGSGGQSEYGITTLGDPLSSSYSAAVTTVTTNAQTRLQSNSALALQIYDTVLTAAQRTALPAALQAVQTAEQARRAQWQAKHATATSGG